jgi:hypothetical protein
MRSWTRCRSNPRLPITCTNTTSIIKQAMTNATLLRTQVTPNDCGIRRGSGCSLRAPCLNSGLRRWLSRCLCRTLYHPHVASDGGVCVSQLDAESLNLVLSSQQTSAQFHRHILVVYHLHPGDIPFHPVGLELIFLPVRQEVWTEFCNRLLLLRTHDVMACQVASATASLREVLKAGP